MYHPSKALLFANAVKAAEARDNAAAFQAENLPANRDKILPANGAWFQSGHGKGPGVNSTFTQGISQTDLDNLRAGKTLYNFSPAKIVGAGSNHHVHIAGHWVHATAYPTPTVNQLFLSNRSISLYDFNSQLGSIEQQFQQGQNRNFNTGALIGIAAFVGAGVAAAALGGTSAATAGGSAATTGGSVAATNAGLAPLSASELATTTAANEAAAAAATQAGLAPLSAAELASTTAANEAASSSLLAQLGTAAGDLPGALSTAAGIKNEVGTIKGIFAKPGTPAAQQQRTAATGQPQSSFWARLVYYLHYAT